jgi:hypothetical protein
VTFNGQVGIATQTYNTVSQSYSPITYASYQAQSSNNLANLTVSANTINLNADITTGLTQTFNGALLVGDNGSNGPTRVLLSEDPAITFNGTINDTVTGTHNLFVKAVTTASEIPTIAFNGVVGATAPLASLTVSTGAQDTGAGALYSAINITPANLVGTVTIAENISTVGDQTYTANSFTLGNGTSNQSLDLTTENGNIAFNRGSSTGSGFTQGGSGLTVGISNAGGTVSGLSGQGLAVNVINRSASESNSDSSNLDGIVNAGTLASSLSSASFSYGGGSATSVEVGMSGPIALASNLSSNVGSNVSNQSSAPVSATTTSTSSAADMGVTVQVQTSSGAITLQSSGGTSGTNGFSFTVPEAVITKPTDTSGNAVKGYINKAQLADGSSLPSWLNFDSNTNTFTANQVPPNIDSIKIEIQTVVGNQVVGTTMIEINLSQNRGN